MKIVLTLWTPPKDLRNPQESPDFEYCCPPEAYEHCSRTYVQECSSSFACNSPPKETDPDPIDSKKKSKLGTFIK